MSVASVGVSEIALALLTQTSMPPNAATPWATASITCASSRMSQTTGSALPPAASTSAAAVWTVPGSLGCGSAVLAARTMFAPSRAKRSAIAKPMPRLAPEMKTVLFRKVVISCPGEVRRCGSCATSRMSTCRPPFVQGAIPSRWQANC